MGTPPTPSRVCAMNMIPTTVRCLVSVLLEQLPLEGMGAEAKVVGRHKEASMSCGISSER
jgi:hypothetical protein